MVSMAEREPQPQSTDHIYRDLTIVLVAFLVVGPVITASVGWLKLNGVLKAAFLLFALYQITRRKVDLVAGLILGVPAVAGTIVDTATPDTPEFNVAPLVFATLFLGFLVWRILSDVLTGDRITSERVSGAIAAYLLIGLMFAAVYGFIALSDPGAFAISDTIRTRLSTGGSSEAMRIFDYFSFVTMTTLGYGDITPVSLVARTAAWFEALLGQLYLAVMIAGLVGAHVARRKG
jgi:voltage-gated potassium channel